MKVAIDISHINRDGAGISYLMKGLVQGAIAHPEHEFVLALRNRHDLIKALKSSGSGLDLPAHISILEIPSIPKLLGGGVTWYYKLARELNNRGIDTLIMPTLSIASLFFPRVLQIINDLSPLSKQHYFSLLDRYKFWVLLKISMRKSASVACISQATLADLRNRYPKWGKPMQVITLGLNKWTQAVPAQQELDRAKRLYNLPAKFILSVSTIQPRKNYLRMIEAFGLLTRYEPDLEYVIVGGKGWHYEQMFAQLNKYEYKHKVRFLGYVPEQDMPGIYWQANTLAFVSLEEGFGLPLIEGIALGLPIVASNIPVFRELQLPQGRAMLVNPLNVEEISAAMRKSLQMDKQQPPEWFTAKYSWEKTIDELLAI